MTLLKLAVTAALLTVAGPAAAQPSLDVFAGMSAGASLSTADDATPLVSVRGGAFVRPDLVVYGEGWTRVCRDSRVLGGGVRYWPWRKLWIAAGAGVSRRAAAPAGSGCFPEEFKRDTGAWLGTQLGADLTRNRYFALELSLRANLEYYPEAFEQFEDEEPTDGFNVSSVGLEFGISFY